MMLCRRGFLAGTAALWAAQRVAAEERPMRIAVISDLNGSYGSTRYSGDVDRAIAAIRVMRPDLVICTGDMVAGQRPPPRLTEADLDAMWVAFHTHVSDPLAEDAIPMLVTPGNHDASGYPGFELERRVFNRVWTGRPPALRLLDGERYPFRYAVSHSGILLIGLDVTTSGPLPAEEMDWLLQILVEEGPRHRSVMVFAHLPLWPVSQGRENDIIGDPALHVLLRDAGVDLVLSGHHHAFFPASVDGLLLVSQAALGGGPRRWLGSDRRSPKAFTRIDIASDGAISIAAFAPPSFNVPLDRDLIPETIRYKTLELNRYD